jgi:hypothetical protein
MTLYLFRLLTSEVQLRYVIARGTYLAQRWDEEIGGINLYHLPDDSRGFFAEIGMEEEKDCFSVLNSFSTTAKGLSATWEIEVSRTETKKASPTEAGFFYNRNTGALRAHAAQR